MCSIHTRIAKQCGTAFEELRGLINTEVGDDTMFRIKAAKQKAADECLMMPGCASAEKYLRLLQSPTPNKRNLPMLQHHLDDMIKIIR